jgi:hypothetical protein
MVGFGSRTLDGLVEPFLIAEQSNILLLNLISSCFLSRVSLAAVFDDSLSFQAICLSLFTLVIPVKKSLYISFS